MSFSMCLIQSWMRFSTLCSWSCVTIEIEIFGQLLPGQPRKQTLELERPMFVQDVALRLGLNPKEIGLMTINGVQSELEESVPSKCRLCFFPHMSGG